MKIVLLKMILLTVSLGACATLPERDDKVVLESTEGLKLKRVATTPTNEKTSYTFADETFEVEWSVCGGPGKLGNVLAMHRDKAGFEGKLFCGSWLAQVFLQKGYQIVAVNRPGFGGSSGPVDFAGEQSLAAVKAAAEAAQKRLGQGYVGIWGYSSGAIVATRLAKEMKSIQWLLLGGGIYDLDQLRKTTKSQSLANMIRRVVNREGEKAIELRSASYDPSGLPKKITLYHGRLDEEVPLNQSESFRDTLVSQQAEVALRILDSGGHDLPWQQHYQLLKQVLQKF